MPDIFDEFTLTPSGGSGMLLPDGPEIIDRTGDAPIGDSDFELSEANNKVKEPKVKDNDSSKKSGEEITSKKSSSEKGSEESSDQSSEEDSSQESSNQEGSSEKSGEEGSEESDEEVDLRDFAKEIYEEIGLEGDFDKDEFTEEFGGKGLESVLKFVKTVIDNNSKPTHVNEEAERYYNYCANGGDPKKLSYLLDVEASYESIKAEDLADNENLTKGILRSYLKELNPKKDETWVDAKIKKYIDSGIAEEEAAEALVDLKEITKERTKEALKAQEAVVKENQRLQREHWENVEATINTSEKLAGVKFDKGGKEKLINFIRNGQYNNYIKDPKKAIELAAVAFMGGPDKFAEKQGTTKATNKLEATLSRHTSKGAKVKSQTMPQVTEGEKKKHFDGNLWTL